MALHYVTEPEVRAIDSALIAKLCRSFQQSCQVALRDAKVSREKVQISVPIERLRVLAVIFQRFRVRLARSLWITKARDGTEVAVGGSGGLAILLKPRSVRPYARRLFFCYGSEQWLSVLRLVRLQQ